MEGILYFLAACHIFPAKVLHSYRPTSVDTASVNIVKGITKIIPNSVDILPAIGFRFMKPKSRF